MYCNVPRCKHSLRRPRTPRKAYNFCEARRSIKAVVDAYGIGAVDQPVRRLPAAIGGHRGVSKTYNRIKRQYHWENLKNDVHRRIQQCLDCQLKKLVRLKTRQPMCSALCSLPIYKPAVQFAAVQENTTILRVGGQYSYSIGNTNRRFSLRKLHMFSEGDRLQRNY
ncbi:unnamed protein product [Trichogramma brassicae]|uniref:Integrase zinc-binding domain-containing protein n=1 Tax=Trichogramma brassicae TaxID=86971 RepID=A0A6H5I0D8_9HYME|nr:unnamed protein product [Trichogramma brassicae]